MAEQDHHQQHHHGHNLRGSRDSSGSGAPVKSPVQQQPTSPPAQAATMTNGDNNKTPSTGTTDDANHLEESFELGLVYLVQKSSDLWREYDDTTRGGLLIAAGF